MNLLKYFKEARNTIRGNTMRSFLSILGIVIGIVSVVVMLGIGQGAEKKLMESLGDLAKNQLQIYEGRKPEQKKLTLTTDTVSFLETSFPELKDKISYMASNYMQLNIKSQRGGYDGMSYYGVPKSYFDNVDRELLFGSFFTPSQYENAEMVAVLGEDVSTAFFGSKNPIGEKIVIGGKNFAVIGVVKNQFEDGGDWKNYEARIPFSTFQLKFPQRAALSSLTIYLSPTADNVLWQKRISYALMKYFGLSHISELNFTIDSFSKYIDEMKEQQKMMNYLLLAIGSISLLVGGIGVMNIMLVSVTERTREIGIRKAIGALKIDIMIQFLTESILITLLGGIIAIILSYGAEFLINRYGESMNLSVLITPNIIILALVITSITGIIFGILPARRAAKLPVIDALRRE
ncbi:ABC transporter permease [candidate division SR1 bacterium]|nr:ABC transporter permease [candidate division SR1 bacterium]